MFEAEDPDILVERLASAYRRRQNVELQLQQQFYIDSMPRERTISLSDDIQTVIREQVSKIKRNILIKL